MPDRTPAEIMLDAMIELDSGPKGSQLFNIHAAEFAEGYADSITAALSALEKAGWVLVPRTPTKEILAAYIAADPRRRRFSASAKRDYRAMLAASPHQGGKP